MSGPLPGRPAAADWLCCSPQGYTPIESCPMPDCDTSVPHIVRVYDYWLGGRFR